MKRRLDSVDWPALAEATAYCTAAAAILCSVSDSYFRRFIKARFGVSARTHFLELRMKRASDLLGRGMRAKEVAYELKFRSAPHFTKCFVRVYRITPTAYLALARELGS